MFLKFFSSLRLSGIHDFSAPADYSKVLVWVQGLEW